MGGKKNEKKHQTCVMPVYSRSLQVQSTFCFPNRLKEDPGINSGKKFKLFTEITVSCK